MDRLLFTVEDRFFIKSRGLIVVPGITPKDDERFRVGDPIVLRRPDGSTLPWQIGGLELSLVKPYQGHSERVVPILLVGLGKDDVPVGTEVWSVDPIKLNPDLAPN